MANLEVKLKDGNDYLFPQAVLDGIDTNNLIQSEIGLGSNKTYTMAQDGYLIARMMASVGNLYINIDGKNVSGAEIGKSYVWGGVVPVKKGQSVSIQYTNGLGDYWIYGIKH